MEEKRDHQKLEEQKSRNLLSNKWTNELNNILAQNRVILFMKDIKYINQMLTEENTEDIKLLFDKI
jgi:hypothetical protein